MPQRPAGTEPRRLVIRFLVSPVALLDNGGAVGGIRLVRNRLVASETGTIQAKATDQFEELPAGLVFRSVGYRGVPLPGVPFDEKWGVVLNEKGRVLDPDTAAAAPRGVHRGLDQARRHRRDRDQQARRRRDGAGDDGGSRRRPHAHAGGA